VRRRDVIWVLASGLVASAPFQVCAQQAIPTVGVVYPTTTRSPGPGILLLSLKEFGWEDGHNCHVLYRFAEGHVDRFPALVNELVEQKVNVIIVFSELGIQAAQHATTTIPIVAVASDMVKHELAASVARPGGNLTGVNVLAEELNVKRLEILHEAIPGAKRIGTLIDPRLPPQPKLEMAAQQLGLDLVMITARSPEEVSRELGVLESAHFEAFNVLDGPLATAMRENITERLNRARVPAIYAWPEIAEQGGLLGYGARLRVYFRQMARLVSRILDGARPQDLPIEQPDRYDLTVNLKTAKMLGVTMPPSILARADEVVE
jgi:putative tryptophan/tyrosine transport system substrate-binding protein